MGRSRWRATAIVGALVGALTSGLVANAGVANGATPVTTAIFNNPLDPGTKTAIEDRLVGLIDGAPAGSTIRLNFAFYSSDRLTSALTAAYQRGAVILAAADGQISDPTFTDLINAVNHAPSKVRLCGQPTGPSSCTRDKGIHHSKYALFSNSGGATDVVFETSENHKSDTTRPHSGVMAYNNAVIVTGQPALYDAYVTRFNAYLNDTPVAYSSANDTITKGYFFPREYTRTSPDHSTVMGLLGNVDCTAVNTSGGWGPDHKTSIHVVQSQWNDANIANKLLSMDNQGCVVHIVRNKNYNADNAEYAKVDSILASCGYANGITQDFIDDHKTNGVAQLPYIHSKYLIIDGNYLGAANVQRLWTGSYNYTYGALRSNDETLLNVREKTAYDTFQQNFRTLATLPTTLDGLSYRTTEQGGDIGNTPGC